MFTAHIGEAILKSGRRIIVTGASGWLGLATLELLKHSLGADFPDRVRCYGSRARTLALGDEATVDQRPLTELKQLAPQPSLVLHLAFLTKDRAETMAEDEYRRANRAIADLVRDSLDVIGAEAVFVASSGAARFANDADASPAMRLYGSLKHEDEEAFARWAEESSKRAVIARIFNISGPHINKVHSYALASFILDALAGRPIQVRAQHPVVRGYIAVRELMSLVFSLLLEKQSGVVRFDSGGQPLEMQAIAEAVAELLGPVAVDRPPLGGGTDDYTGDDLAYRRLLAEHAIESVPFAQQVIETAQYLRTEMIESR